jgi:2-furoyl-CoA dehydrogenase FAD binding subunit
VGAALKPAPFSYLRPETVDEALAALATHGVDGRVIAGGQSLGAMLNMRLVRPKTIIDINRLSPLSAIAVEQETVTTGALVRQADALADPRLREAVPLLALALPYVGHYQTRHRGTLGGSVAHADPSAEIPLVLATLGGDVELRSRRGRRWLKAAQFFQSTLVTAREPHELVMALRWPRATADQKAAFIEFAVREGDYAIVAVACVIDTKAGHVRLGFGGCGEAPQIIEGPWPQGANSDKTIIQTIARDAAANLECRSDMLATADYRKHLAAVLAGKALLAVNAPRGAHA